MSDGWYPAALNDIAHGGDAGPFLDSVTRGCLHTTESSLGRYTPNPKDYGGFGHTNYPHFTCDVKVIGGKRTFVAYQHISIRRSAKALKNLAGGVQTNRLGVIQIEVVGSATSPFTSDPVMVEGLAALMRWIESQTDIAPACGVTFKGYPGSYGTSNGVRMTFGAWQGYKGWLGHQHVPENDHGDPGALVISALLPKPKAAVVAKAKTAIKVVAAKVTGKDPVLRQGDHGQSVKNVQHALVLAGYHLAEDGAFGPATTAALKAFQRSRHLTADGVVGSQTWAALRVVAHPAH